MTDDDHDYDDDDETVIGIRSISLIDFSSLKKTACCCLGVYLCCAP